MRRPVNIALGLSMPWSDCDVKVFILLTQIVMTSLIIIFGISQSNDAMIDLALFSCPLLGGGLLRQLSVLPFLEKIHGVPLKL